VVISRSWSSSASRCRWRRYSRQIRRAPSTESFSPSGTPPPWRTPFRKRSQPSFRLKQQFVQVVGLGGGQHELLVQRQKSPPDKLRPLGYNLHGLSDFRPENYRRVYPRLPRASRTPPAHRDQALRHYRPRQLRPSESLPGLGCQQGQSCRRWLRQGRASQQGHGQVIRHNLGAARPPAVGSAENRDLQRADVLVHPTKRGMSGSPSG